MRYEVCFIHIFFYHALHTLLYPMGGIDFALRLENEQTIHQSSLQTLKDQCSRLETQLDNEKRDGNTMRKEMVVLERRYEGLEKKHGDVLADRRDLLRLVDIMSASPMGIKSVLEAYLSKLGR